MATEISPIWKDRIKRLFPELEEGVSLEFTSEVDFNYNCLAWSLGCDTLVFEKSKGAFWMWPSIPDDTAEGWAMVVEVHGFTRCPNADFTVGYEKIAILKNEVGDLHAARTGQNGKWKSKLGIGGPDIDHDSLEGIKSAYGEVVIVLEKYRQDWVSTDREPLS